MTYLLRDRIPFVFAGLTLVTLLSWYLSSSRQQEMRPDLAVTMAVVVFAVVKARFVLRDFMEIGHASRWLRVLSDVWVVGLPIGILIALSV